jgi:biotin transport system substrate-specific component
MMNKTISVKELTIIGVLTALTAILSPNSIALPFSPVPITLVIVAVYVTGILLKPKLAVFTQVCYLLVGAVGLPVFSGFRGGLPALFGPTGGYLLVYPLMAWIVSLALNSRAAREAEQRQGRIALFARAAASVLAAQLVLYAGGSLWMGVTTGTDISAVLAMAVFPFIPLDIVKIVFCVAAIVPLRQRLLSLKLVG